MESIYIPQLTKAPQKTQVIQIDEFLPDLETLTPVRGRVSVAHKGSYLEVSATAETIITLNCHRCLQQFNHRLSLKTSEMIWLDESAGQPDNGPLERETAIEDLVESLPPQGYFEPDAWLYEQMCLAIPRRQLCDENCQGIQPSDNVVSEQTTDRRWASLADLKKQLS